MNTEWTDEDHLKRDKYDWVMIIGLSVIFGLSILVGIAALVV